MMLTHPTLDQMQALGLAGMAVAWLNRTMPPISVAMNGSA